MMKKTCKTGLGQGLCLWGTGLVASVFLATSAQAFFNGDSVASIEPVTTVHYNTSGNASGKFKMSVEAEGSVLAHGIGDMNNNLSADMKGAIQEYTNEYPTNYWY